MALDDLKDRIYREKEGFEEREGIPQRYEPGVTQNDVLGSQVSTSWGKEPKETAKPVSLDAGKKKKLIYVLIGLAVVVVGVAAVLFFVSRSFDSAKVAVEILGRDRVVSGEEISYVVRYKNGTKSTLQALKLTFFYPPGSIPLDKSDLTRVGNLEASVVSLPDLKAGEEGKMEFRVNITGLINDKKEAKAKLSYRPQKISTAFENEGVFISTIFSVPLIIDFDLPDRIVSGQQVVVNLKYINTSDVPFSDLVLMAEYPEGFIFGSSSRPPDKESNVWKFAEIGPKEEGKIIITGSLSGNQDEVKLFKAKIGKEEEGNFTLFYEAPKSTLISLSPLWVQMTVKGQRDHLAEVGELLFFDVRYKNTADVPIGPASISIKFDTKVLNFATLQAGKAYFNNNDISLFWNESVLPDLKLLQPKEDRNVTFTVKVSEKDALPVKSFNDKNFTINLSAKIDSPNVPASLLGTQLAGSDSLNMKLNSALTISSKAKYNDPQVPNTGPIPPRVGQETTYTVSWDLMSLSNDADNTVVESYLPPHIKWLGIFAPGNEDVKYDQNTGKLTWRIGRLPANTGVSYPVKNLTFKIGLIPTSDQTGESVDLVKETVASGTDVFTGASLRATAKTIRSDGLNDPTVGYNGGRVAQ